VHELEIEKDRSTTLLEAAVTETSKKCKEAEIAASREAQRRISVESEISNMHHLVLESRAVAETASFECKRLRNAVLAVSQVRNLFVLFKLNAPIQINPAFVA
jgi:hypothetical protein